MESTLEEFLDNWNEEQAGMKMGFVQLMEHLQTQEGVTLEFHPRPGVTYSLRGTHASQSDRPLFVMVDVIEGEPRWLSVCFYNEMVTDPEERGDFVPGGLLGEDGLCFDMEEYNEETVAYLFKRVDEAYTNTIG